MLLKSLIAAAFLAKYLLPMRINAQNSQIGNFKEFDAIIEDPQNVKNDISTFAGRMVHFSKLFTKFFIKIYRSVRKSQFIPLPIGYKQFSYKLLITPCVFLYIKVGRQSKRLAKVH